LVSLVSNGDASNDMGVEFDGEEGVLSVFITGVEIAVIDGVFVDRIEAVESRDDESSRSSMKNIF
jgi:hypothetical protein